MTSLWINVYLDDMTDFIDAQVLEDLCRHDCGVFLLVSLFGGTKSCLSSLTNVWIRGSMDKGEGDLESLGLYLLVGEPMLLL